MVNVFQTNSGVYTAVFHALQEYEAGAQPSVWLSLLHFCLYLSAIGFGISALRAAINKLFHRATAFFLACGLMIAGAWAQQTAAFASQPVDFTAKLNKILPRDVVASASAAGLTSISERDFQDALRRGFDAFSVDRALSIVSTAQKKSNQK